MPSVGTVDLTFLKGEPPPAAATVERLERAGVDGFGAREGPVRAMPQRLTGIGYAISLIAANALVTAIRALQGTLADIIDENATTHADCLIELATETGTPRLVYLVVGTALLERWRVEAVFDVVRHPGA
jgi:hypothetical protein